MAENNNTENRKKIILAVVIIVITAVVLTVVSIFNRRGEQVPKNPEGTVGNIAGNIYNGGIVCESEGRVFFSNPYDGGALYSMTVDENDCKKISPAIARSICAAGDYIYYFQMGSSGASGLGGIRTPHAFIRSHKDGKKGYTLYDYPVASAQVIGDYIYMEGTADNDHSGPYFIRVATRGGEPEQLATFGINPACAQGNIIYYNRTVDDHNVYTYNTVSGSASLLFEENAWNPILDGGYIYYMAPADGYQLRRYSVSEGTIEILTKEKVESFNIYNGYIYYQTFGDDPHLAFMNSDGSGTTVVANGVFNSISMTSGYVYFKDFFNDGVLYHSYHGSTYYEPVRAASEAAMLNLKEE